MKTTTRSLAVEDLEEDLEVETAVDVVERDDDERDEAAQVLKEEEEASLAAISSATSIISRTCSRTTLSFSFEPLFSSSLAISRILLYSSGVNADVLVSVVVTVVVVVVFSLLLLLNSFSTSLGDNDGELMRSNSLVPLFPPPFSSFPLFLFLSSID